MYEADPLLDGGPTELQDLLMCEAFLDDLANNNQNPTQPPSASLSEFEAQIQALLAANNNNNNNNNLGTSDSSRNFSNDTAYDFNNFQYSVPTSPDNPIFGSPESFLNSPPHSYTSFDDNLSSLSPPQFNNDLQDFIMSPNDTSIIQDSGQYSSMEKSLFDQLNSNEDLDTFNLMVTQQVDKAKKRVNSTFDRDSIDNDKSSKKKRKGLSEGIDQRSPKVTLGNQLIKDEPLVSNILCNDGTTQSIVIPSSPEDLSSSNYAANAAALLALNGGSWNKAINPSTSFVADGLIDVPSQFTSMPLLVREGVSTTAKLPINRLKPTTKNTKLQQNNQSVPNKQQKKVAHNAIERRYRNNINDRINDLKNVVPALCHLKSKDSKDDDETDEVDGIPAATKLNKATILRKATEYITYLKSSNQKVKRENETLRKLIEALPGGIDLFNAYISQQQPNTPPTTAEGSPSSSIPGSPDNQDYVDYNTSPTSPAGNTGSRALMALFMCMTFFTSPSSYNAKSHPTDDHHESRVITSSSPIQSIPLDVNSGVLTIDIWYLARILTFMMCLTYILRPSLFSSQPRRSRKSNSIIASVLNSKTKDAKALYQSLSSLTNGLPSNIFEIIIGLISEFIKFSLRRLLGWDITSSYTYTDDEGKLLEVALWGRMGEVELCGGNDKISRLSILYTCLRTINLLESSTRRCIYFSSSRIYANAALQSYIGLSNFPSLAERFVQHFWKLANKGKGHGNNAEEKWFEIALNSDPKSEMWKKIANRINDYIFEKPYTELMKNITIPLTLVTDVQAMNYLKQAYYNFISTKYGGKKKSFPLKNKPSLSFLELIRNTTPNSFTHWYALVGCSIEAFYLGHNKLGENFVNRLKETVKSDENDYDKQIIACGLLSYALLMQGKLEASLKCANKASIALTKRKELKTESLDELNNYSFEIEQDIHCLTEFCVGWIVLEAKTLGWKIVEGLSSSSENISNNSKKSEKNENDNTPTEQSSATTKSADTESTTTSALKKPILDSERLQSAITLWTRYLRRLSKNSVFEGISKIREIFIKKLVILENIADNSEYDLDSSNYELHDDQQHNYNNVNDNNSQSLSESEIRAIKAWSILKGM